MCIRDRNEITLPGLQSWTKRTISKDQLGKDLSGFQSKELEGRYAGKIGLFNAETGEWMTIGKSPIRRNTIEEIEAFKEEIEGGQLHTWKKDFFNRFDDLPLVIVKETPNSVEYDVISVDKSPADVRGMVEKYHEDRVAQHKAITKDEREWEEKRKQMRGGSHLAESKKKSTLSELLRAEGLLIAEGRLSDTKERYKDSIHPLIVDYVAQKDPSDNHKYLDFLMRYVSHTINTASNSGTPMIKDWALNAPEKALDNNLIHNTIGSLKDNIKVFHEKQNIPNAFRYKDLNDYIRKGDKKSWPIDFIDDVKVARNMLSASQAKKIKKQGVKLYNDDRWLVVVPLSHDASCYYGAGTRWCTTTKNNASYYNRYKESGELYYIIDKKGDEKYDDLHKAALNFTSNDVEVYDALDRQKKLTVLETMGVPKEALLKIVEDVADKQLHVQRFIYLLGLKEATPMIYKKYKDQPEKLLSTLGYRQLLALMGEEKAMEWLKQNIAKGNLTIENTGGIDSDFVKQNPLAAVMIARQTDEDLAEVTVVKGVMDSRGTDLYDELSKWGFGELRGEVASDVEYKDGTYWISFGKDDASDLFDNPTLASQLLGEDYPDLYSYGDYAPDFHELWNDYCDEETRTQIKEYLHDTYKEDYADIDFLNLPDDEVEDMLESLYDESIENELRSAFQTADGDARTNIMINQAFDEINVMFDYDAPRWYQAENSMFNYPLKGDMGFWELLNVYADERVDWDYTNGDFEAADMMDVILELQEIKVLDSLTTESLDVYADIEDIIDAGFNEITQDRIASI